MNYLYVSGQDMKHTVKKFKDMNIIYDYFKHGIFEGFEGFSPIDIDEYKCQFILAIDNQDIIGVIKFKRYKLKNHEYLTECDFKSKPIKNYKGIMFIDVRSDYRQNGVARNMIKLFCDITKEEGNKTEIRLGRLTDLGKKANLLNIFKDYLPGHIVKL